MEDLVSGKTKSALSEVSALMETVQPEGAENLLTDVIAKIPFDELKLVQFEIEKLISLFLPKRRKRLTTIFESRLLEGSKKHSHENPDNHAEKSVYHLINDLEIKMGVLGKNYIFQWGTYYKDFISYVYNNCLAAISKNDLGDEQLDGISELFKQHAREIAGKGYDYSIAHGVVDDLAVFKTTSGMQQFLYLIMNSQLENFSKAENSNTYKTIKKISSKLMQGIIDGYALALGWDILYQNFHHWIAALGFMRGQDAGELLISFKSDRLPLIFENVIPVLLASDRFLYECAGNDYFIPRLSRVALSSPFYLDINYITNKDGISRDLWVRSLLDSNVRDYRSCSQLDSFGDRVIVTKLENFDGDDELGLFEKILNSHNVSRDFESANLFADSIFDKVNATFDSMDSSSNSEDRENYASQFPLNDPDFRRLFIVDRNSVNALLESIQGGTGVHLWCSARRSGKTTAAEQLVRVSDKSMVVFQTMDSGSKYKERLVFETAVRELTNKSGFIEDDYFQKLVYKCAVASTQSDPKGKKITLILDEYESLFGILEGISTNVPLFKYQIVQPLLSQIVAFATENMIIFMGQKPDAYYILPAQNQLSPLVKQHSFPLFEHHLNATDGEFPKFLKRVLTEKLPFNADFCNGVFEETSGHPYLTVNLMVDFCDWLIKTDFYTSERVLDKSIFEAFVKRRLTVDELSKSHFYQFFQTMLNQYLGEYGKKEDYWLYLTAKILKTIATKHPRVISCSAVDYVANAKQAGLFTVAEANQFLSAATMANFLRKDGSVVKPGIKIMARLAACAIPGGL